jgi:hypothetical protein
MARRTKIIFSIAAVFVVIGLVTWLTDHVKARKRQARYQAAITNYASDLRQGISRNSVEQYLQAHDLRGQHDPQPDSPSSRDVLVLIGEDPSPWYCNHLYVFAQLQFDDEDKYRGASLKREFGQCL